MAICIWKGERIRQLSIGRFELTNGRRFDSVAAAKAYIDGSNNPVGNLLSEARELHRDLAGTVAELEETRGVLRAAHEQLALYVKQLQAAHTMFSALRKLAHHSVWNDEWSDCTELQYEGFLRDADNAIAAAEAAGIREE